MFLQLINPLNTKRIILPLYRVPVENIAVKSNLVDF